MATAQDFLDLAEILSATADDMETSGVPSQYVAKVRRSAEELRQESTRVVARRADA